MNKVLFNRVVVSIQDDRRLRGVPIPVIEEVVAQTIDFLVNRMEAPDNLLVSELDDELESCEGCAIILRDNETTLDKAGIALCSRCFASLLADSRKTTTVS